MDKYDEAIQSLTRQPGLIRHAWNFPTTTPEGCLFDYCGEGCLTQVKGGGAKAFTQELTEQIKADRRIPGHPFDIKVTDLAVFAEWQRKIDKEYRTKEITYEA